MLPDILLLLNIFQLNAQVDMEKQLLKMKNFLSENETKWNDIKCVARIRFRPWKHIFSLSAVFHHPPRRMRKLQRLAQLKQISEIILRLVREIFRFYQNIVICVGNFDILSSCFLGFSTRCGKQPSLISSLKISSSQADSRLLQEKRFFRK